MDETKEPRETAARQEAALSTIRLAEETKRVRQSADWAAQDRRVLSLLRKEALSVRLVMLKRDAELPPHPAPGSVTVHVLAGSVLFHARTRRPR
jgi:quercetin dioxygenase-like cupin family protein